MSIAVLSFTVWLHHFFTMGQDANVNAAFGIATMLIGIPTGVKIYDWMATMYRGRVRFTVPMVYAIAFMVLFVLGGLSGIILANPSIDFQVHNTLFLVAHFHNMLIPGLLFGMLAGYTYWFPKLFGFRLNEKWGYISAYGWIAGFVLVFFPMYVIGLMGMTRRTVAYTNPAFQPWMIISGHRRAGGDRGAGGTVRAALRLDPRQGVHRSTSAATPGTRGRWNGRRPRRCRPTTSPSSRTSMRARPSRSRRKPGWAIRSRRNTPTSTCRATPTWASIMAVFGTAFGFGMIWYMWWLAALSFAVMAVSFIARALRGDRAPVTIPAAQVEAEHRAWLARVRKIAPDHPRTRARWHQLRRCGARISEGVAA